ncbi:MAG: dioxygenase [Rhodobacteraceae bacterium]|nr:dioxygenase [Paracoccaceae bacterium]
MDHQSPQPSSQPSLFVSHGSPTLVLDNTPARDFLKAWGSDAPRPKAILVISAHWETEQPTVSMAQQPETIHDFGRGFPQALFDMQYPAPGAPDLADRVYALLNDADLAPDRAPSRGLDHGAWVPLSLMFPEADLPVTQLSVNTEKGPAHHHAVGAALRPLRNEGVMILASGAMTHDLQSFFAGGYPLDAPAPDWVTSFGDWAADRIASGDDDALMDYRAQAPHGARNHPTEEHLLPLFVALGAGDGAGRRIHRSHAFGILQMDAYQFDGAA